MKFLSASTGREWASLDGSQSGTTEHLDRFLADLLLSENLIVLCGLGTSLAVTGPRGVRLAPTMQDLWNGVKASIGQNFDSIAEAVHYAETDENIELLLSHAQMIQSLTPETQIAEFVKTAEQVIVDACRFVTQQADLSTHTTFLQKVARRSTRLPRMRLFTTNYDVCFERAASHTNFIVVDGFSHTHPQTFDGTCFGYDFVRREQDKEIPDYLPNVFQLYKLHGSIDWEISADQIIRTDEPTRPLIIHSAINNCA